MKVRRLVEPGPDGHKELRPGDVICTSHFGCLVTGHRNGYDWWIRLLSESAWLRHDAPVVQALADAYPVWREAEEPEPDDEWETVDVSEYGRLGLDHFIDSYGTDQYRLQVRVKRGAE